MFGLGMLGAPSSAWKTNVRVRAMPVLRANGVPNENVDHWAQVYANQLAARSPDNAPLPSAEQIRDDPEFANIVKIASAGVSVQQVNYKIGDTGIQQGIDRTLQYALTAKEQAAGAMDKIGDTLKKVPTWAWIAGGAAVVLLIALPSRRGRR